MLLKRARAAGGVLALVSFAASAGGEASAASRPCRPCPPQCCPQPVCPPQSGAAPVPSDPGAAMPPVVPTPGEAAPAPPSETAPTPAAQPQAPSAQMFQAQAPSEMGLGELAFAASGAGYIDLAAPLTMFRIRYDALYNGDFSIDRAEYMYPAYANFLSPGAGPVPGGTPAADVDLQEIHAYLEYAFNPRFSVFGNVPIRWVDTTLTDVVGIDAQNGGGLGDIWVGFKYALIASEGDYLTFQTKVYTATGREEDALGTGHASIEPGLLFQDVVNDDVTIFGEAKYWIPFDTTDLPPAATGDSGEYSNGGVFQYGLGAGIDLVDRRTWKLQSVNEVVGWTAIDSLHGEPTVATCAVDASGDTIVNLKLGARLYQLECGRERSSVYAGWGHALTGDIWYEDLFRLEYRMLF